MREQFVSNDQPATQAVATQAARSIQAMKKLRTFINSVWENAMTCRNSSRAAAHASPSNSLLAHPRPLVLAMHLAFAGGLLASAGWSTEAHAQATAAAPATRSYDIPAGPLSDVLTRFSTEAGIFLAGSTELAQGKNSRGVRGTYGVQAALDVLLAGTGLEMQRNAQGRYVLRVVERVTEGVATLPAVSVTAQVVKDGTTEGSGSYTTRASSTATKLNLSPRETPQTLTVVTRQKMDDFGLTSLNEVLESTSGVVVMNHGRNGSEAYSRGFTLQNQYDGIPNPIGIGDGNRGPFPDTAFLDKVEILQGASGLMSGAGEPGGTLNLVRKRPTQEFQAHVETQLGSWNKKRLVGDVFGALVESGAIRGRAVAFVDHSDSFTDYVYTNKQGFYGVVEADVSATTTVSASVMNQKNDFIMDYGVPRNPDGSDIGFSRSRFFGLGGGASTKESTSYTLGLEQKLPQDWSLKAAYAHTDATVDAVLNNLAGTLNPATGSGLILVHGLQQRRFKSDVFDVYASGPFQAFGRKHELVLGAASSGMSDKSRLILPFNFYFIPNIYTYDGGVIPRPSGNFPDWPAKDETTQRGVYGAARLNLADSLKAIVGTRVSWYEYKAEGVQQQKEDAVVSPYAGLIYDINKSTSVYASYSDIFKPQSSLKFGGGTLDPVVGKNYELGIKSDFLQERLNVSAAVFRLEQTNLAQVDLDVGNVCNGGACYKASGLVVSQGVDLGLNGEVLPGWQVGAGYTYVYSKTEEGADKGKTYSTFLPQHVFRAYTTYLIPGTSWTIGGNIRSQSKIYLQSTDYYAEQGGIYRCWLDGEIPHQQAGRAEHGGQQPV